MVAAYRSSTAATGVAPAEPAGAAEFDVLLAQVYTETTGTTPTAATGWTFLTGYSNAGYAGRPMSIHWYVIRRGTSAVANNWSVGGAVAAMVSVWCFSGCKRSGTAASVINASLATQGPSVSNPTITLNGITTTVNNCLIAAMAGYNQWVASSSTDFTNERVDQGATGAAHFYDDGLLATAGATGNMVITGGDGWAGYLFALEPETGPVPPTVTGVGAVVGSITSGGTFTPAFPSGYSAITGDLDY